ncbi:MAG TPA: methionine biosynthesis protein MetW [Acidobacteriota bacterium]|nr:methionine biosynthesis protein MetW [Acidobacteriota bacterium]
MRFDLRIVTSFIEEGSRVLDLGCGTGDLLSTLREKRGVEGRGIEIDEKEVIACVEKGLSVLQGDMHEETRDLADGSFDYVILSQTLQQVYRPERVIGEMLRVGEKGIVSFPCFSHYAIKAQLLFRSRAPVTRELPYQWYDTPNIRVITLKDFRTFCADRGITILKEIAIASHPGAGSGRIVRFLPDWFARYGIFLISRAR